MKQSATQATAWRIACALAAITCAILAAPHATHAQCQYEITSIIQGPPCPPFGSPTVLIGRGMNSHGHVTGSFHDCNTSGHDHGFFWTPETGLVAMHKPFDAYRVNPNDISDAGLIVGTLTIAGTGQRGFVYDMHTQQYLALLQPLHGIGNSSLNAINNAGIAVGARSIGKPGQSPNPSNAVIWNTNTGEVIDLGVGEGPNSLAVDGNNPGDAVGWSGTSQISVDARALLWTNRGVIYLGALPGHIQSVARSINDNIEILGRSKKDLFGLVMSFYWNNGVASGFDPPAQFDRYSAASISNVQQILGTLDIVTPNVTYAALFQHGEFHLLNDLVNLPESLTLTIGIEVRDDGRLLARGSGMGNVAVVLTPIGQPLGDLNHDCRVDVHDLLMLLDAWGPIPRAQRRTGLPADLNGDGVVDVSDLLILLANWSN